MKKFDKEIEQLRKIEHSPEEAAMLQSIAAELEQIRKKREKLKEENRQLRAEYNRAFSKKRENQIEIKLQKVKDELTQLQNRENNLNSCRQHIFRRVQDQKCREAEKRIDEIRAELQSLQKQKQEAHRNFDKNLYDQLTEKEKAAGEEMAELTAVIKTSRAAVSEMDRAARDLRATIEKQTAAEAVKLFDQLAALVDLRTQEEAEILSIEDAYNNTKTDSYNASMFSPYTNLRRSLERNYNLIEELRRKAAE